MSNEMINKRLQIIDDLTTELNQIKSNYEETLENDPVYQEVEEEKEKVRNSTKEKTEKILLNSSYKAMADQLREKRQEIKEQKEVLAQELLDFYRESGQMEIEDPQGNVKRMKFSVRLVS
jgi:hypothetical protein